MKWLILIFLWLPLMAYLIYCIRKPKESYMLGRRWQFQGDVEPSEMALDFHRMMAIVLLVVSVIAAIALIIIS